MAGGDDKGVSTQESDVGLCIVRVQVQPDKAPPLHHESRQPGAGGGGDGVRPPKQTLLGSVRKHSAAVWWCLYMLWWVMANNFGKTAGQSVLGIPQFRKDFGTAYEGNYVLSASWQSALYGAPQAA